MARLRILLLAAIVVTLIAIAGVGLYRSLRADRRPAPLSLAEAVEAYRSEVEESLRAGSYEQAETQLQAARELREAAPQVYHELLGRALLGQPRRFAEAEAQFREALRHDPAYDPARRNLALLQAGSEGALAPPGSVARPAGGEGLLLSRGRLYFRQFQRGELEQLHRNFSPQLAAQMSIDALRQMQAEVSLRLGEETEMLEESVVPGPNFQIYTRTARFANHDAAIDFIVQLTGDRRVAGLEMRLSRRGSEES